MTAQSSTRSESYAEERKRKMAERGYTPTVISDTPYRYEDQRGRPNTIPQQRTPVVTSQTNNYNQTKKFPLIQIAVPYLIHPEKEITIPVLTDFYYNPSDRNSVKHVTDWQRRHTQLEIISIDYAGTIYPYEQGKNQIRDTFEQSTQELGRFIDLVQNGELYSSPRLEEKIVYIDRFPFRLVFTLWAMMGIIVYLITLLFMATMR